MPTVHRRLSHNAVILYYYNIQKVKVGSIATLIVYECSVCIRLFRARPALLLFSENPVVEIPPIRWMPKLSSIAWTDEFSCSRYRVQSPRCNTQSRLSIAVFACVAENHRQGSHVRSIVRLNSAYAHMWL